MYRAIWRSLNPEVLRDSSPCRPKPSSVPDVLATCHQRRVITTNVSKQTGHIESDNQHITVATASQPSQAR